MDVMRELGSNLGTGVCSKKTFHLLPQADDIVNKSVWCISFNMVIRAMLPESDGATTNELYQLDVVAFCLLSAWVDKLGLSLELGSFMAGVMISTIDFAL
uniref:Uncharacterized protein n=1 Tax=Lactuca sativa TaxID=4236 RepID=A0A9R1XQK5_LACSA|nr:hypothetical protein LSAT_V11C300154390 [Lactuca sativa]